MDSRWELIEVPGFQDDPLGREHRILAAQVQAVIEKVGRSVESSLVLQDLVSLRNEAGLHFEHEEDVMERFHYPDFDRHRREHARLLADLDEMIGKMEQAALPDVQGMPVFLGDWFFRHIVTRDMPFGIFLEYKVKSDRWVVSL